MPFWRNIFWMALTALLAAGCRTATVERPVVTEITLPTNKPFVLPSPVVDTNALVSTNISVTAATNLATNLIPFVVTPPPTNVPSHLVPPGNDWLPFDTWCQASGHGKPQKLRSGQYTVGTRTGSLLLQPGSQMARWDGTQIWLGYAPRIIGGQLHLHWLDVLKILEPLHQPPPLLAKPGRVLVIDPGHGGSDGGTISSSKQQVEKHLALDWALRLQTLLRTNGWKVFLTRSTDVDLPLTNRVAFADQVGADLFLSLHFNGLQTSASHSGVETFCLTPPGLPSSITRGYEDNLRVAFPNNAYDTDNLQYACRLHRAILAATRAIDGGVRHARFLGVLRGQHRPAVLIEGGFLSNPEEARRLATPAYRQKLAEAVARALSP